VRFARPQGSNPGRLAGRGSPGRGDRLGSEAIDYVARDDLAVGQRVETDAPVGVDDSLISGGPIFFSDGVSIGVTDREIVRGWV
jgi:hypothetical protein